MGMKRFGLSPAATLLLDALGKNHIRQILMIRHPPSRLREDQILHAIGHASGEIRHLPR
jgi:hypothetical protein